MNLSIDGIHHVTAIASDPQRNLDFYTRVLGLRLVKLTVNFDAPDTYHFYFGDENGHPGTILTFFPWPEARRGQHGSGQATWLSFSIPAESITYWVDRLRQHGQTAAEPVERFGDLVIPFTDPDGLQLELTANPIKSGISAWQGGPVPADQAVRGIYGITLIEEGYEKTAELLTDIFGFEQVQQQDRRTRFQAPSDQPGGKIDIVCAPDSVSGRMGAGIVHHVAWRTPTEATQLAWRERLVQTGLNVTPVLDRRYFHSIYFREPGGVLFEIATDLPGFATDETVDRLGTSIKLPPWLEPQRAEITRRLPILQLPESGSQVPEGK